MSRQGRNFMETKIVNIRKEKYDVYIGRGRGSIFGNPFIIDIDGDREEVIDKYRSYFWNRICTDTYFRVKVYKLKGKILGCYCKPLACHGDVIAEFLDD